jgi:molybdopterin synthase catalytic subunit
MFELSEDAIVPELPGNPAAGACVTFEGRVRNENEGRPVQSLVYEAYADMAVREGQRVVDEAMRMFGVLDVRCIHRIGHLNVGDLAVWIAVTAGHRDEAFKACRYVIDEIKQRVPIWKKEVYGDGDARWIGA